MAVVVSDTTPIHYLVLIGQKLILERLYGKIIVPMAVFDELCDPSAPSQILRWMEVCPPWITVKLPKSSPKNYDQLDRGEREALALAKGLKADLLLLDDKAARRVALREGFNVKGTLGIVAEAARANMLDFARTVEQLQRTNMHLHPEVVAAVMAEFKRSSSGV